MSGLGGVDDGQVGGMTRDREMWKAWPLPASGVSLSRWQEGRCAWCGYDQETLVRDHCHDTGLIRGLLCRSCNQAEGYTPAWNGWSNEGDHAANAVRHFEVYTNHLGQTPLHSSSALIHYTGLEQEAWWAEAEETYLDGGAWPRTAPWTEVATARRESDMAEMREALGRLDGLLFGGAR